MPDRTVIEELERLLGEATEGPWLKGTGGGGGATTYVYDATEAGRQKSAIAACTLDLVEHPFAEREANAALIATMKNALPALLECARALEPFAKDAEEWANEVPDDHRSLCTEPGSDTAHPGSETIFTVGDLRRARQALAALEGVGR